MSGSIRFIVLLVVLTGGIANSYKILAVFPSLGFSHHIVGSALFRALAEKGHEVTVISSYPSRTSLKNYFDIDCACSRNIMKNFSVDVEALRDATPIHMLFLPKILGRLVANCTLSDPNVRKLLHSKNNYDAIIYEAFEQDAFLGFGHVFNAPVIGLSTFGASALVNRLVGTPSPLSYVPDVFLSYQSKMSFSQRLINVLYTGADIVIRSWVYESWQGQIYQDAFPDPKPPLFELARNVSLVLVNSHFTLGYPRPYVPNMIEVGGIQLKTNPDPLPADLQTFLDSAMEGAIYFSMGSNVKGKDLPLDKRLAILKVIGTLKQKVLWKFEDENLPGKPSNLLIKKWFPQNEILAHPNVKVFISHGGLLSTTESVYYGVPILGIPMFGDQYLNIGEVVRSGWGAMLDYLNLTEETLSAALQELLNNKKYKENANKISQRYRDQPLTPLETAIYWVEYVIRHKGAPHMRSAGQDLNFIQYHNLDVFAFMTLLLISVSVINFIILKRILKYVRNRFSKHNSVKKNS